MFGYEANVRILPVGKKPTGKIILELNKVYGKFTCGFTIEGYFIVWVHATGNDVVNKSTNGGKLLGVVGAI